MKAKVLQAYTKQESLISQNSVQILQKFLQYTRCCIDPHNIFSYMEEKSICVYLAHYWTAKAQYYSQIGDYRVAFECLNQGASRSDIITEDMINFQTLKLRFAKKLISKMKSSNQVRKRSKEEYQLFNSDFQASEKNIQMLLQIYEDKYFDLKDQISKAWEKKIKDEGRQKSWRYQTCKQSEQKLNKFVERISLKSAKQLQKFKSMTTPAKKIGLHKLNKTIDSVELMKKKNRSSKNHNDQDNSDLGSQQSDLNQIQEIQNNTRMYHSMPIRKASLDRKVKFSRGKEKSQQKEGIRNSNNRKNQTQSCLKKGILRSSAKIQHQDKSEDL